MNAGDWSVLDIDGVIEVARKAAAKVANKYTGTTEYDDLYQDALILLATQPDTVRDYVNDPDKGLGLLHHRLWCDLVDSIKTDAARRSRHVSYELVRAEAA